MEPRPKIVDATTPYVFLDVSLSHTFRDEAILRVPPLEMEAM